MATRPTEDELSGLRVLAHPLRLRILSLLTGAAGSAMEMSRQLGVSQALASYHLRQLHQAGVIELAEIVPKRGGRERRYRYRPRPERSSGGGSDREALLLYAQALCVELRRRVRDAESGHGRLSVDAELWVDPADWTHAIEAIKGASVLLHHKAQPPRSPGTVRVSVSALLFAMTAEPAAGAVGEGDG